MPFSKIKLDRKFLQMLRVKSDWCNQLTKDHLESLLQINKDEESLKMFNSEPLINHWLNDKVQIGSFLTRKLNNETPKTWEYQIC